MAGVDRENYSPSPETASNAFVLPEMPGFRPQPMLNAPYPSSLAFWHNPHILQPVADPSHPAFQAQMAAMLPEQKKHKRTRSGCYTCRSRRVKVSPLQLAMSLVADTDLTSIHIVR